jgi:thiamine-monophosphate kinase
MKLSGLGEDRLLAELLSTLGHKKDVVLPAGDDCAIVRAPRGKLIVLKCDCVVETVHFRKGANPRSVGWKAMMRPLSDFAAVSALPRFALVTLLARKSTDRNWVLKVYAGLTDAAARFGVEIVGGETSKTPGPLSLSVSVFGYVEERRWVSRSGGKAGDDLFVTGRLGGSLRGRHLTFVPRIAESRWLTANFRIHAMMDLSDGLGADLPRLAKASRLGFQIDEASLPLNTGCSARNAISDGEDYELLFAVSPRDSARLQRGWKKKFPKITLTQIGRLIPQSGRNAGEGAAGLSIRNPQLQRGYIHFK